MNKLAKEFIERRSQELYLETHAAVDSVQLRLSKILIQLEKNNLLTERPLRHRSIHEIALKSRAELELKRVRA